MYQEVLRSVEGVGIFPAISLVVFVAVFGLVVLRAARMDRSGVQRLAALPLDEKEESR
jgi:hypothetical protein